MVRARACVLEGGGCSVSLRLKTLLLFQRLGGVMHEALICILRVRVRYGPRVVVLPGRHGVYNKI